MTGKIYRMQQFLLQFTVIFGKKSGGVGGGRGLISPGLSCFVSCPLRVEKHRNIHTLFHTHRSCTHFSFCYHMSLGSLEPSLRFVCLTGFFFYRYEYLMDLCNKACLSDLLASFLAHFSADQDEI